MKMIFLSLLLGLNLFAQSIEIETQFLKSGYLIDKPGPGGNYVMKFKKKQKCIIINYFGYNYYQVKFNDKTGYILSEYLTFNEKMKLLEDEHEEKRLIELKKKKEKKELIYETQRREEEKKREEKRKRLKEEGKLKLLEFIKKDSLKKIERRSNCHYQQNSIDEFDNVKIVETEYYSINNDFNLAIKLKKRGSNKIIYFSLDTDLGCASSYNTNKSFVKVKLENNDIVTFYHFGDINCRKFTLIGRLSKNEIDRLKKSNIKSIRLQGTDYYKDLTDIEYKEFFKEKLNCIN